MPFSSQRALPANSEISEGNQKQERSERRNRVLQPINVKRAHGNSEESSDTEKRREGKGPYSHGKRGETLRGKRAPESKMGDQDNRPHKKHSSHSYAIQRSEE